MLRPQVRASQIDDATNSPAMLSPRTCPSGSWRFHGAQCGCPDPGCRQRGDWRPGAWPCGGLFAMAAQLAQEAPECQPGSWWISEAVSCFSARGCVRKERDLGSAALMPEQARAKRGFHAVGWVVRARLPR